MQSPRCASTHKKALKSQRIKAGKEHYGHRVQPPTQPHHVQHTPDQGFAKEDDLTAAVLTVTKDGINYHINLDDEWFFSGMVTTVDLAAGAERPQFTFQKEQPAPAATTTDSVAPATDATTGASRRFESYWE